MSTVSEQLEFLAGEVASHKQILERLLHLAEQNQKRNGKRSAFVSPALDSDTDSDIPEEENMHSVIKAFLTKEVLEKCCDDADAAIVIQIHKAVRSPDKGDLRKWLEALKKPRPVRKEGEKVPVTEDENIRTAFLRFIKYCVTLLPFIKDKKIIRANFADDRLYYKMLESVGQIIHDFVFMCNNQFTFSSANSSNSEVVEGFTDDEIAGLLRTSYQNQAGNKRWRENEKAKQHQLTLARYVKQTQGSAQKNLERNFESQEQSGGSDTQAIIDVRVMFIIQS